MFCKLQGAPIISYIYFRSDFGFHVTVFTDISCFHGVRKRNSGNRISSFRITAKNHISYNGELDGYFNVSFFPFLLAIVNLEQFSCRLKSCILKLR